MRMSYTNVPRNILNHVNLLTFVLRRNKIARTIHSYQCFRGLHRFANNTVKSLHNCYNTNKYAFGAVDVVRKYTFSTIADKNYQHHGLYKLSPYEFSDILKKENIGRCYVLKQDGQLEYSHEVLKDVLDESQLKELDHDHEAVFFHIGQRSDCLMSVFLWRTNRGQGVSIAYLKYLYCLFYISYICLFF